MNVASGGARAVSGPPPDPNALRRDRDGKDWTSLPRQRVGDAPPWPLTKPAKRELALWDELWTMPQAVMWDRNRQSIEVAVYVRTLREAEVPGASIQARNLVKQQMEALGLSQPGMLRLRWRIEEEARPQATTRTTAGVSARDRLRLIESA